MLPLAIYLLAATQAYSFDVVDAGGPVTMKFVDTAPGSDPAGSVSFATGGSMGSSSESSLKSINATLVHDGPAEPYIDTSTMTIKYKQKYSVSKTIPLGTANALTSASPFQIIWCTFFNGGTVNVQLQKTGFSQALGY